MTEERPLQHSKHIFRAFLLLLIGVLVLLLGRGFFVPATWGQYGGYRAANVEQQRGLAPQHGGDQACLECHPAEHEAHAAGGHMTVRCELCHGPVAAHAANGDKIADMPVRRTAQLCILCHERLAARPETHPQVQPRQHLVENGAQPTPDSCFDCHDPHVPL